MQSHEKRLADAFLNCAPFCNEPSHTPNPGQGLQIIKREMHTQLLSAMVELLSQSYGFTKELESGAILARCMPSRCEDTPNRFCFFAANEDVSGSTIVSWRKRVEPFIENFRECASRSDGVSVELAENVEVLDIRYMQPEDMWKALWVMTDNIHPDNIEAMSHIRSIVHLNDRMQMGGRGRHLC